MYHASSLNTLFALILWHTWININSTRQHAFRKKHNCETQMITVTNNKAKILKKDGQVDTCILDFKKGFDTPTLMNYINATYMAIILIGRLKWVDFFSL